MCAALNLLRNVRAMTMRDESRLRTLRHILCQHLQLPGALGPLLEGRATVQRSDEEILELVLEGLLDFVGEGEDDNRFVDRARRAIDTMLNKIPTIEFLDGAFHLIPATVPFAVGAV
jgi:hypothetical protein